MVSFVESAKVNDEDVLSNTKKVTIMGGGSFGTYKVERFPGKK